MFLVISEQNENELRGLLSLIDKTNGINIIYTKLK